MLLNIRTTLISLCLAMTTFAAFAEKGDSMSGRLSVVKSISTEFFLEIDADFSQNPFATLGLGYKPVEDTSFLFELGGKKTRFSLSPMAMLEAEQIFHGESAFGEQELKCLFEIEICPFDIEEPVLERGFILMSMPKEVPLELGAIIEAEGIKKVGIGPALSFKIFDTEVQLSYSMNTEGNKGRATAHYKF